MKRKRRSLTDPAYEIIGLLRTKGFKVHLLPPDKEPEKNSKEHDNTLKNYVNFEGKPESGT